MLALLFIEVIVLSASRTGLLGMAALMGWGLFDRRLSRATRILLLCSPLAYLALWGVTSVWVAPHRHGRSAAKRASAAAASTSPTRATRSGGTRSP